MNRLLILFFGLFLMNPALAGAGPDTARSGPVVATVSVGPMENGDWSVEYRFTEPQTVLAFARSKNDYREATWSLQGNTARFGRVADLDLIVFDEPANEVSFSIIPLTSSLVADYTPFVLFGDGGLAIYEGQFNLVPVGSIEAAEALEGDLSKAETGQLPMAIEIASDKPIIVDGKVHKDKVRHVIEGDGTYIYIGDGEIESFDSFTVVLDKTLPDWLQTRFDSDLAAIFAGLEDLWGFSLEDEATVMLAFKGAGSEGFSAQGGALDQLLMMQLGGSDLNAPDADTLAYLQWFFAHEAVHLFQSDKGIGFADDENAWIHEGAANTMAYGVTAAMMDDDDRMAFLSGVYANAFVECVDALEAGPLNGAGKRDDFAANYACGDFIALATDGFLKRRTLYAFWNMLTDNAASLDDPVVNLKLYLTTMQLLGATKAQRDMIEDLVTDELSNPRKALTDLLKAAGLEPAFNDKGQLVSMDWPDYAAE